MSHCACASADRVWDPDAGNGWCKTCGLRYLNTETKKRWRLVGRLQAIELETKRLWKIIDHDLGGRQILLEPPDCTKAGVPPEGQWVWAYEAEFEFSY